MNKNVKILTKKCLLIFSLITIYGSSSAFSQIKIIGKSNSMRVKKTTRKPANEDINPSTFMASYVFIGTERIIGLNWRSRQFQVTTSTVSNPQGTPILYYSLKVSGLLAQKNPNLSLENSKQRVALPMQPDGNFEFSLPVSLPMIIKLSSINRLGKTEHLTLKVLLTSKDGKIIPIEKAAQAQKSSYFFTSIGPSLYRFNQTKSPNFSSTTLTLKVAYTTPPFLSYLDIGASGRADLFQIAGNSTTSARFFGFDARLGASIPASTSLKVSLLLGLIYNDMLVSDSSFGYHLLMSYYLAPAINYSLGSRTSLRLYLKYVPLSETLALNLRERELTAGASLELPISKNHTILFSADYTDLNFDVLGSTIHSNTGYFGIGYGW